ncbi:hypothetical protein [Arenicella chitinivorans]|nr:hypothetical protein [Arenicella chitinivorans]
MKIVNIVLLTMATLIAGCGAESNESDAGVLSGQLAEMQSTTSITNTSAWNGVPSGYISDGDPKSDRTELFVRFGQILAATTVYRRRAEGFRPRTTPAPEQMQKQIAHVAAAIDDQVRASSAAIAPVIEAKMHEVKQTFMIHDLLLGLTQEQQLQDLLNQDRSKRDVQQKARQNIFDLQSRLYSAIVAFFPSRHEFMLASSALIREAGDKMATAVSSEGVIVDIDLLEQAYSLIDLSVKLDPKNVTFCESQRAPIRNHKSAIDELLSAMVPLVQGQKIKVTASEAYELAARAQAIGEGFPKKDSNQCS